MTDPGASTNRIFSSCGTSPTGRIYRTTPGGADLFPEIRLACNEPRPRKGGRSRETANRIARARMKIRDQRPVDAEHRRVNRACRKEIDLPKRRNQSRKMLILFKGKEPSTSPGALRSPSPWCTWINEPFEPEELPPDWEPPPPPASLDSDDPPF